MSLEGKSAKFELEGTLLYQGRITCLSNATAVNAQIAVIGRESE